MNPDASNSLSSRAQSRDLSRVKLMDSGSCFLSAPPSTKDALISSLQQQGGHVAVATGEEADGSGYRPAAGDLIWDCSDLFHYQMITAHVEPSGEGCVAVCREGSAATPLLKAVAWAGWMAASVAAGIFLPGGWAVLLMLALLLFTAWLVLRPSQKSVRRMLRLTEQWHR